MKAQLEAILADAYYAIGQLLHHDDSCRAADALERIEEAAREALAIIAGATLTVKEVP